MARLEIFTVALTLTVAFNVVACLSNENQSNIKVSVVPSMAKYLIQNPGLKVQPLIKETKVNTPVQYATRIYSIGYRVSGKIFEFKIFTYS